MSFKKDFFNKVSSKNRMECNSMILKKVIDENRYLKGQIRDLKFQNKLLHENSNNLNGFNNGHGNEINVYDEAIFRQLNNENVRLLEINSENEKRIEELTSEKINLQQALAKNENIVQQINKYFNFNEDLGVLQKKLGNYKRRDVINKILKKDYSNLTIAIKSPHPEGTKHWGDYFFSLSLRNSFEKLGFKVVIHERENWYDNDENNDITIVLRGLINYEPDASNINILWNISHPDMISNEEFEKYDIVFISSVKYANKINNQVKTIVKPLLQCTDPNVFFSEPKEELENELLFVGTTRGVYREIIKDVLATTNDVSIYGGGWDEYVDKKYIKGEFIPNEELHKYYSSCKILLNDHWEDMKNEDFPSNRLFDALACGTFVLSDKIPSAETVFNGSIITYDNVDDLNFKINYYLNHETERIAIAEKGKQIVLNNHTFDNRVDEILTTIKELDIHY